MTFHHESLALVCCVPRLIISSRERCECAIVSAFFSLSLLFIVVATLYELEFRLMEQ